MTTMPNRNPMHRRRTRVLAVVAVASALVLAGCGGNDDDAGSRGGNVVVNVNQADSKSVVVPERRFFNDASPWNRRIDSVRTDPASQHMIDLSQERVGVVERPDGSFFDQRILVDDGLYINTTRWTVPVVAGGRPTSLVCRQLVCGDGSDTTTLNIPDDVDPDPRYDGWYTVFDTSASVAYDLWRARREDDDTISYNYMRKWDLNGPGYSPPWTEGARGSGLPLFAGLIRPGELESGEINHALAISLPGPAANVFVQPASSTDGTGRVTSIPEGARIRLKRDVVLPQPRDPITGKLIKLTKQQQRLADAIVACLRTYGAIVVDRAAVPTLYAQRDVTDNLIHGNELQGLTIQDFEVLPLGQRYHYPPEENEIAALVSPSASPTSSPSSSPTSTPDQGAQ
ncbi:hypothetical protein [Nocardioides sp. URHA0032]|uniref:hypothetical protein n=1 Tax=Nocardioides sp. URHA0032 TaxID=1380388 RepID=UPI00048F7DE6|nr:hypothetical protein [Nocardioides sp. URHA0032]